MNCVLAVVLSFALSGFNALPAAALSPFQAAPETFIYRVVASECIQKPARRVQTGFRINGMAGIVTALHGILDCKNISAQAGNDVITELSIVKVDIPHDAAVLWSIRLAGMGTEGLIPQAVSSINLDPKDYANVTVMGYPYGLRRVRPTINIAVISQTQLIDLLPDKVINWLWNRRSPELGIQVLELQGPLVPGHSGAPLLNTDNKVVGIGNGGLDLGRTDRTWAIPWHEIDWKVISTKVPGTIDGKSIERLKELEKVRPELFRFEDDSEPEPDPSVTVTPPTADQVTLLKPSNVRESSRYTDGLPGKKALDGRKDTYWLSKRNNIEGAFLEVIFSSLQIVSRIGLYTPEKPAGKTIKSATLTFSDGSSQRISLRGLTDWEYVDINPVSTNSIILTVDEVYDTSSLPIVSLSELQLLGKP